MAVDYYNVRDARGRFAPSFGGGSGSLSNETAVHSWAHLENLSAQKKEAHITNLASKIKTDPPPDYPNKQVQNDIKERFNDAARTELQLSNNKISRDAIDKARKQLGCDGPVGQSKPTTGNFEEKEQFEAHKLDSMRHAGQALNSLFRKYDEMSEDLKDHPASYLIEDAKDTLQGLAESMGLDSPNAPGVEPHVGTESSFGPGKLPTDMNSKLRRR